MKRGLPLVALAALAVVTVLVVVLPRPGSPAAAQAPSSADPVQIVRIHNGVYLYWHEPASGGGITGYDIQHRSGTSGNWGTWTDAGFSGTTQPAVVTSLTAGTTYQFRVRAENASGKGAWSDAPGSDDDPARVVTVAASAAGVPNTVKSLSAEAGDGSITLTWTAPHARAGVAISGYTVFWRYYDEDDAGHSDSAPSIAATASSYTISGLVGGRAYDVWMRAHASGKASRDSMAVYDVTPGGGRSGATPPETASPTATATANPGPRALGGIAPRGGGALTVVSGESVRLDLDLSDAEGGALTAAALARAPLIGWYIPVDAHAQRRQHEARTAVVFEETFPDQRPRAPLASIAGEPGSVRYTAPVDASGTVVVRAVVAAADCPGGGGGGGRRQAAAWNGPCSAEFTISVTPAVTIAAVSPTVGEGDSARFTVSRTGPTVSALTVAVSVSETGTTFSGIPPTSLTIPAAERAATLDIPTEDDEVRETDSVVTVMLTAPAGYVAGPSGSAAVTVEDDDPLPSTTLRYDTYDLTGAVTEPGSYAFLSDESGTTVVITYEGLRDGTSERLLIHTTDAGGTSRAAFYDTVRPGDLFEWRKAADCFVRYRVTAASATTDAQREFGVRPETYAFQGCQSGSLRAAGDGVATTATVTATFTAATTLPPLGGAGLRDFAVVHGTWQIVPAGWTGATEAPTWRQPPAQSITMYPDEPEGIFSTRDPAVARRELPYWRDPALPEGLILYEASSGTPDGPLYGYCAEWGTAERYGPAVRVCGYYADWQSVTHYAAARIYGPGVLQTRTIAGRPAMLLYSPTGPNHSPDFSEKLWIYDPATESEYEIYLSRRTLDADDAITIARSLFESPNPK